MLRMGSVLALAALLLGCQTTAEQAGDPMDGARIDCQRIVPGHAHPDSIRASEAGLRRAHAAGMAGAASMPAGYAIGGAIAVRQAAT